MYSSDDFKALAEWSKALTDEFGEKANTEEIAAMKKAFIVSSRDETKLWDRTEVLETC